MAIILIHKCPDCGTGIEHGAEAIGELVQCPGCKQVSEIPEVVKERRPFVARAKLLELGGGPAILTNLVQVIGCLICLTVIGIPIGLMLISYGGRQARRRQCSECRTVVNDAQAKLCPGCRSEFDNS